MTEGVERPVEVDGAALTTRTWGDGPPSMVLLHDGLGSIGQWRDVPARLADATGRTVLAYDRAGHGRSTPVPDGPWPPRWLHREAEVLARLLAELDIGRPVLVGHSDGGSIALLHAAVAGEGVAGVVALAAHTWVEQVCVDAIAALRADPALVVDRLARHHAAPAAVFDAWSGVWTGDAFRTWDIRPLLGGTSAPVLVVQGAGDEYATDAMVDETVAAVGPSATGVVVPGVGHLLHHQAPDVVVDLVARFVAGLPGARR